MWILNLILTIAGLISGFAVSAGVFALIASLGLIPRFAGKTSSAAYAVALENAVIAGGIIGTVISMFPQIPLRLGTWFTILAGTAAGMFIGCLSAALAEVLNVFPILFRRSKLKTGLEMFLTAFALGKLAGGLYYFIVLYP
jgi:stage V sporulation protein AB